MAATPNGYITIVIGSASVTNPGQFPLKDQTLPKFELNALIDYLSKCAGGNEIVGSFYVVTRNTDPAVTTDGGTSTLVNYTPAL